MNVQPTPISVIIPVRNEGARIARAIRSIIEGRSCCFPLELVIVDDASTDGACESLEQLIQGAPETHLTVQRLESWSGIPYARNRGAEIASYPIFFITDGNTRFPRNWDIPIWRYFSRGRILAATIVDIASSFQGFGCQVLLPSMGVTWIPVAGVYGGYVPVAACAGTVIDRSLFHYLGGYDESLPLYGAAEPEFSVRAWLSGYEIVNVPELYIGHRFRPKGDHDAFLSANNSLLRRNYLRFACCYLPDDLLMQTFQHYKAIAPDEFNACLASLAATGVWAQREQLQRKLPLDFRWFAHRFGLRYPQQGKQA
jgi:glycosyltransferase involved in cell wall biosynthesis